MAKVSKAAELKDAFDAGISTTKKKQYGKDTPIRDSKNRWMGSEATVYTDGRHFTNVKGHKTTRKYDKKTGDMDTKIDKSNKVAKRIA